MMTTFGINIDDSLMHVALVLFSVVVLLVSVLAYARKRNSRYLFLSFAFLFLLLSQAVTLVETIFLSNSLIIVPYAGVHLAHVFDFLMLFSFVAAITRKPQTSGEPGGGEEDTSWRAPINYG
jgi:heme A synthase